MKKITLIVFFNFSLFILTACNMNYLSFEGEGDNWFAKQEVSQIDGREETKLMIKYIGGEIEEVRNKTIVFSVTDGIVSNSGEMSLNEEGILETTLGGCESCASLGESGLITVEIERGNGNNESFILTSTSN